MFHGLWRRLKRPRVVFSNDSTKSDKHEGIASVSRREREDEEQYYDCAEDESYNGDEDWESSSDFSHSDDSSVEQDAGVVLLHFDKHELANTMFPEFDWESLPPEGELTEISSDEESIQRKQEKYQTKEDQDVAVFLQLTQRMSLSSLLHLLQGQVVAQHMPPQYLQERYGCLVKKQKKVDATQPSAPKKLKQFRFAQVSQGKVREVVHPIQSYKHCDLWWKPEEMQAIRKELVEAVQYFRRHRPEYTQSVTIVAQSIEYPEEHMKKLTQDSFARGLESHIVRFVGENRRAVVKAVLEEQDECRACGDNYEMTSHCLREQALAYSKVSTQFAYRMAKCDHVEALKASMSRWRRPTNPYSDRALIGTGCQYTR